MTDLLSRVSRSAFGYLGGDGGGGGGGENEFVGSIVDVDGMQIQVRLILYRTFAGLVCLVGTVPKYRQSPYFKGHHTLCHKNTKIC